MALTEHSIASRITDLVLSDEVELPPLPAVAMRAQELLSSERLDVRRLGEVLNGDAAIAASLLRLANSASFGGLGRVHSVGVAVQRIGMREAGAIVTGLALRGHFDHPSPAKKELLSVLWDHSVTTAFAARVIGRELGVDPERAFLGGLLHDCGKVIVLAAVDRLERTGDARAPTRGLLLELMGELHPVLGHHLLRNWNLAEEFATIARDHQGRVEGATDLLLSVQAANLVTRKLGYHLMPEPDLELTQHPIIEDLDLSDLALATLMIDMEDHLAEMRRLF